MPTTRAIAEDIKKEYGALLSISQVSRYFGMDRGRARNLVKGLPTFGTGTGKRYFYLEVAERLKQTEGMP